MIRWMLTMIAVHGTTERSERKQLVLVGADGSCPVCDHPFGDLAHACLA